MPETTLVVDDERDVVELAAIVHRAMARARADRFPDMRAFAEALEARP